jgi:hypothetical protein
MHRYAVNQFDGDTFQVVDLYEQREVCVCADYDNWEDSEKRAKKLAHVLNEKETEKQKPHAFKFLMRILKPKNVV